MQLPPLHQLKITNNRSEASTQSEDANAKEGEENDSNLVIVSPISSEISVTNSTQVDDTNYTEDIASEEPDTPMPDRKKKRLLTRVPSRSICIMSAEELRKECKFWKLPTGGRKDILVRRLDTS